MSNTRIKIYFDSDGVLADMQGYMDEHGIIYNPMNVYDVDVDIKMWDDIRKVDHFYLQLKPLPGSVELFKKLREKYDCEVLTAEPKEKWNIPHAGQDKIDWVKKFLGEDVVTHIVYRNQKQDYALGANCILVDDLEKNIKEWEAQGGTGILFTSVAEFDEDMLDTLVKKIQEAGFNG